MHRNVSENLSTTVGSEVVIHKNGAQGQELSYLSCSFHWTDGCHGRSHWVGSQLADVFLILTWYTRMLFDDVSFSERSELMLRDDGFIWLTCSLSFVFSEALSWCSGLQVVCIACDAYLWDCQWLQDTSSSWSGISRPRFGIDKCHLLTPVAMILQLAVLRICFLDWSLSRLGFLHHQLRSNSSALVSVALAAIAAFVRSSSFRRRLQHAMLYVGMLQAGTMHREHANMQREKMCNMSDYTLPPCAHMGRVTYSLINITHWPLHQVNQ